MKAKKIMSLISLLSCIALISVGFASWYIVGNDSKDISGQFVAEAVTDNSVSIVDASFTDGKVHFGAPESSAEGANYWLVNSDYEKEDLTAILAFKITNASGLDSVEVKMSENGNEKYNASMNSDFHHLLVGTVNF